MKLRFKGKAHFMEYHGAVNFVDGEIKDVPDGTGNYLLAVFGDFFTEIFPVALKREMTAPPKDKMVRKAKTKTKTKKR